MASQSVAKVEALTRLQDRITPTWVRETLGEEDCTSAEIVDFSGHCGLYGDLLILRTTHGGEPRERVIKTFLGSTEELQQKSQLFGLWREAAFFQHVFAEHADPVIKSKWMALNEFFPKVYYSEGNPQTGEKLIVMEKMSGSQTGLFMSVDHPIFSIKCDKGKADLEKMLAAGMVVPDKFDVCVTAFRIAAQLHSTFWMDEESTKTMTFLNGFDRKLLAPDARPRWEMIQGLPVGVWAAIMHNSESSSTNDSAQTQGASMRKAIKYNGVDLSAHLVDCITSSQSKIDFDAYCSRQRAPDAYPWSLVHGDFHAGNLFAQFSNGVVSTKLLDLEFVGLGSGPQDLAQFMVVSPDVTYRRQHEKELVREVYYSALATNLNAQQQTCRNDVSIPDVDRVWEEYKEGGACRWLWLLPLLVMHYPAACAQYFCNQVSAFLEDHFPGEEGAARVPMPRI